MSRAFVKETAESAAPPERMVDEGPNLVTPEGLAQIDGHIARIESAMKTETNVLLRETLARDLRYWEIRKASAEVAQADGGRGADGTVGFGSTVTIKRKDREQTFRIVGVDEADAARGLPLYINLRDHTGAKYPDEILERHARDLGLSDHSELVKAWRSGLVDLILDGFDELAATGWSSNAFKLRQIRRTMLEAVRKLISESRPEVGIIIAGRHHYFDSTREMCDALGLGRDFRILRIETLSEQIASQIVKRYGGESVPDWVPSRALLLSYLAAKEFLQNITMLFPQTHSRGFGWDTLLKMVSDREAQQHPALEASSILAFIERLATIARQTSDGMGSFSEEDLSSIFHSTCGFSPDDAARVLISRLPALGAIAPESGRRRFIDPDIADAARSGDVASFISSPYDTSLAKLFQEAQVSLSANGMERLCYISERDQLHASLIEVAAENASKFAAPVLAFDAFQLLSYWNIDFNKSHVDIRDMQIDALTFDEDLPDFSRIQFWDCIIEELRLAPGVDWARLPHFKSCLIGSLDGVATIGDLPQELFQDCEISELAKSTARNAEILNTDLPMGTKVLLTILNKLFIQAGRGRRENAFVRGLDPRARELVPQILDAVQSFGFAAPEKIRNQTIWLPKRDKIRRVGEILAKPTTTQDPLAERIRNL